MRDDGDGGAGRGAAPDARVSACSPEERARLLLESIRDYAIFLLDRDGVVTTWNSGAEHIFGYTADEIRGKHYSILYPVDDRDDGKCDRALAAAAQGRFEEEGWRVRKDGHRIWADVILSTVQDAGGRPVGFAHVTRDLSERKLAEETARQHAERFRLIVEGVKDYAIFMLDAAGRVVTWNQGAQRIKQYRAEEIIGQHFSRFYSEEDVRGGKCERELAAAERDGRFEDEAWRVRKDGSSFWANVVITALRDPKGELVGFAKVTRDLTERRKLEEERVQLAKAQEAIRLRDEFLSIASHELKTPLTALQLQLESVRERVDALDHGAACRIDRAARSGERLGDLIEALLDVSRIATGRFELSPQRFDLADAAREAVEGLRASAAKAHCELVLEIETSLVGTWDRVRIEQVLTNLVSNAIKYAAGAPIEVSLTADGDIAVIEVRDHGPGIPEPHLHRIFGRFERAASMRHYGGLGLGLYVSREIVAAHGGDVTARNDPGGGARFTVRLPSTPRSPLRHDPPVEEGA